MNIQEAIALIIRATDQLRLTRTEHIRLQQAINLLEGMAADNQAQKEVAKEPETKPIDKQTEKAVQ